MNKKKRRRKPMPTMEELAAMPYGLRRYYENRERILAQQRKRRKENPAKTREYAKKYYKEVLKPRYQECIENPQEGDFRDRTLAAAKRWRERDRERSNQMRRGR